MCKHLSLNTDNTQINLANIVGGDGDDRDRPNARPDPMGSGSDWRPPYSGSANLMHPKKRHILFFY